MANYSGIFNTLLKSTYDSNNSGIVDDSELLLGENGAYYLSRANHTGTQLSSTISDLADQNTRIAVEVETVAIGTRRKINFLEGSNVTLSATDNNGAESIDLTISSTGGGGGSSGYVALSTDDTLTSGGAFYTDSLTADITITLNLAAGESVEAFWVDTSYDICFTGITSINGTTVPENQGVYILITPLSWRTIPSLKILCTATGVYKVIEGNYNVTWKPGFAPPYTTFTFTGDATGDMADWLGTTNGTVSWVNPATSGAITTTQSSAIDGTRVGNKIFDKSLDGSTGVWHSQNTAVGEWVEFQFNNNRNARINRFYLRMSGHPLVGFDFQIYLNSTWTTLKNIPAAGASAVYDSGIFTNDDFSSNYRLISTSGSNYSVIGDIALYGDLMN